MCFLWFFLGMLTGGCIGIITMCLFQINRLNEYEKQIKEIQGQLVKPKEESDAIQH